MAERGAPPGDEPGQRLLRAVYEATFFVRFAFGLTVSVSAAYIAGHFSGLSLSEVGVVGIVTSAAPIGEFSTVLLSGIQADHYGRLPVLFAGMTTAAALFVLISFTRSAAELGIMNLVFGVASGAILAASLAIVGDQTPERLRGAAMGRFDAMNLLGWVLGFAVGFGVLGSVDNSALPWVFRAGAFALVAGLLFAVVEVVGYVEPVAPAWLDLSRIRAAVLQREVLLVTLPWLVIYMLIGAGFAFLGSAGSAVGVAPYELGILIGGAGLLLLLTQPYFGHLADRFGRFRLMVVGTAGFLGVMASLVAIALLGARAELLATLGVSALAALAYGPAALAALTDLSHRFTRGTTMAVYSLVISVGMILGLLLSSTLYSRLGQTGVDLFFALIAVLFTVLTALRGYDLRTGRAPPEPRAASPGRGDVGPVTPPAR